MGETDGAYQGDSKEQKNSKTGVEASARKQCLQDCRVAMWSLSFAKLQHHNCQPLFSVHFREGIVGALFRLDGHRVRGSDESVRQVARAATQEDGACVRCD